MWKVILMQSYTFLIPSKWTLTSLSHSNEGSFSFSQAEHFKRKVSIILSKTEQLNTHLESKQVGK